jgi:hypothetical protein
MTLFPYTTLFRSTIIAVPDPHNSKSTRKWTERWQKISGESEIFDTMVDALMNTRTRPELMRLRDLALAKRELRPRSYKWLYRRESQDCFPAVRQKMVETVTTGSATEISTNALPILW